MNHALVAVSIVVVATAGAAGQANVHTNDSLTGLPVSPATVVVANAGNDPVKMPGGRVCKSTMEGNFYSLSNYFAKKHVKVSEVTAWYASHLSGFNKASGYDSHRSQTAFYNSDRTILLIVTGSPGAAGEDTNAYSVAYERYQPGLSQKTITSLTQGKILCKLITRH